MRDPHPAGSLGTRHGLSWTPLLRLGEHDLTRPRDAAGPRRPPAHQRQSRDVRSHPAWDVPRGALPKRGSPVHGVVAPRRGELRRPIPLPASRPSVVTQYPTPRRAEHPRHPAPEQGASAGSRDNHGPVRQRSETAADHALLRERLLARR